MVKKHEYYQGYVDALVDLLKHVDQCWGRNLQFQAQFPNAPNWQRLTAKYGALTQEALIHVINARITEAAHNAQASKPKPKKKK